MSTKVFDVHGDVNVNTKDAERAINRIAHSTRSFGDSMLQADRISVSLTRRMRSGFDTGMLASIRRNELGLLALGNAIQVAGAGLQKIENESVMALRSFQRLQRVGFALQSTFGVIAGSIGDLSGAILSLVGVLGQAAYAFVGVGGALASVVAGFAVAKIAMGGIGKAVSQLWNGQNSYNRSLRDARKELKNLKFDLEEAVLSEQEAAIELEKARTALAMAQDLPPDNMVRREAELAYQRADLNYRRAKSRVNDLQDTIKRGGNAAARAAAANPFKNLTKSQIAFAKYLVTLKPVLKSLKEAAASSFLPPLQTAIEDIVDKTFPTLEQGFKTIGSAMGDASKSFSLAFTDTGNLKLIKQFFDDSAPRLRQMGVAADRTFSGILSTLSAAKPLTDQFTTWVSSISAKFDVLSKSKSFKRTLDLAGYVSSQLGHVFGSFGDGIKNIMDANFPPGGGGAGQVLLDWLNGIASGFKKFTGSDTFAKWLKDTTTNATTMLSTIGDFLHIFVDLAGRPEIKKFWTTLEGALPSITKMLSDGIKAGPSFAELIVSLTKLMAIFSDSGVLTTFFDTLKSITDIFIKIFTPLKDFLDAIGRVHGWVLAVTAVMFVLTKAGMLFMAFIGQLIKNLGKLGSMFGGLLNFMTRFNTELAIQNRGIVGRFKALKNALFQVAAGNEKASRTLNILKDTFRKAKTIVSDYILSEKMLGDATRKVGNIFSSIIPKIKQGFGAVKATVVDAGRYIRLSLIDGMQKFKQVASGALGNAKLTLYTTLIQKGRFISDFYNNRVIPVMRKFRDLIVTKFNDAKLPIYTSLLQKGRMIADLYNTRVVPAFKRFQAIFSAQNMRTKAAGFAIGMMMHIDLIDKRIIPALQRGARGISAAMASIGAALSPTNIRRKVKSGLYWLGNDIAVAIDKIKLALSPQNIRMHMRNFVMAMSMHLDLIDSRIVPALMRAGNGIASAVNKIKAALSPQAIKMKMMGFAMGMLMQIDLIDNRIIPAFRRMRAGINTAITNIRLGFNKLSMAMRESVLNGAFKFRAGLNLLAVTIRQNLIDINALSRALSSRFKDAIKNSTLYIKLQAAASKLATTATNLWKAATSKISAAFSPVKSAIQGFIDKIRQKNSAQNSSAANDNAATVAINKQTEALKKRNKAAAQGVKGRRSGAGMGLMGAAFAAEGLISSANNGGLSAGSAMTTIGGAAMFAPNPYVMAGGMVLSIVGAIVQGFEAAAEAEKQKNLELIVENAQIEAQKVLLKEEQVSSELSTLMASGTFKTLDAASAEILRRQAVATDAANAVVKSAGLSETKLPGEDVSAAEKLRTTVEAVRLAFVQSGTKITDAQMPALLKAASGYAAFHAGSSAQDISTAILSTFTQKGAGGGLAGVASKYAIDPNAVLESKTLTPGGQPVTVRSARGVNDLATEIANISAYVKNPANQVQRYSGDAKTGYKLAGKPELDTSGLKNMGISSTAYTMWLAANSKYLTESFDPSVLKTMVNTANNKFTAPKVTGKAMDTGFQIYNNQSGMPEFGKLTLIKGGAISAAGQVDSFYQRYAIRDVDKGIFSTKDIAELRGTQEKPLITSIKPSDIAALKADPNAGSRSVTALEKLAGLVDSAGGYLQIKDISRTDKQPPQIQIPAGLKGSERYAYDALNAALKVAWGQ